ncbi:MAG: histidine kinase, partial [Bryobacteraceae bacterium]
MFWRVQAGLWAALFVILTASVTPYLGTRSHLENLSAVVASKFTLSLAGFLLSGAIRPLYDAARRRPIFAWAPRVLVVSFVGGNLAITLSNLVRMTVQGTVSFSPRDVFAGGTTGVLLLVAWSAGYLAFRSWQDAQEARLSADRAQLAVLRYQVNPHFLFNSLNTLQSLIREDPARASEAVSDLAAVLRYSLRRGGAETAPLAEELEALRRYLAVEQSRFEEKLSVDVSADSAAEIYLAPAFVLHPLVENAIKHGMQTSELPLRVEVRAQASNGDLRVRIRNTGRWREGTNGTGVGLENLRDRLERLYPGRHLLATGEADGWVESQLEIRG